jgi:hypothetical protein
MFEVFLLLEGMLEGEFFLPNERNAYRNIIAVQKLSGNKTQSQLLEVHTNNPPPRCFCCADGYIWPGMCFVGIFLKLTGKPVETIISATTTSKLGKQFVD